MDDSRTIEDLQRRVAVLEAKLPDRLRTVSVLEAGEQTGLGKRFIQDRLSTIPHIIHDDGPRIRVVDLEEWVARKRLMPREERSAA